MALKPAVLQSLAAGVLKTCQVPGLAVAVVGPRGIYYMAGHGRADIGARTECTCETGFAIASISKGFTAALLLELEGRGMLHLDDPIGLHLPAFEPQSFEAGKPALRDALSHATGFSGYEELWYDASLSRAEILSRLRQAVPADPPRRRFRYSNLMFMAAGEAAAYVTRMSYEKALRTRLLEPCGHSDIVFRWSQVAHPARPYSQDSGGVPRRLSRVDTHRANAALGLKASVSALSRWMVRLLRGAGLSSQAIERMWTPQIEIRCEDEPRIRGYFGETKRLEYGMGWFLGDHQGMRTVSHTGALPGFRSHLALVPELGVGVAALANLDRTLAPEIFIYSILDLLAGRSPSDWFSHFEDVRRARELQQCEERSQRCHEPGGLPDKAAVPGVYEHPVLGRVRIGLACSRLRLEWQRYRCELVPLQDGRYRLKGISCPLMGREQTIEFLTAGQEAASQCHFLGEKFPRVDACAEPEPGPKE